MSNKAEDPKVLYGHGLMVSINTTAGQVDIMVTSSDENTYTVLVEDKDSMEPQLRDYGDYYTLADSIEKVEEIIKTILKGYVESNRKEEEYDTNPFPKRK